MKTLMTATAVSALMCSAAFAEDIKLGVIYGFTGPIESLTGPMAAGAELAMKEVTDSGLLLGGSTVTSVRADSTCIDSAFGDSGQSERDRRRGLLWCNRCGSAERCTCERHSDGFTIRDIPSALHG